MRWGGPLLLLVQLCGDPCWHSPRLAKFTEALSSEPEVPLMGLSPRHQTERLQEEEEEEEWR